MSMLTNFKAQKALRLHSKGKTDEAMAMYAEAYAEGLNQPRPLLAYATLLVRNGDYEKAQELLRKTEKAPGLTTDQKTQIFMDYAVCCYKLGDLDKGIRLLERQHQHQPTGLIYQTLGYLYAEKYDATHKPTLAEWLAAQAKPEEKAEPEDAEAAEADEANDTDDEADDPAEVFEAEWRAGLDKALAYCQEAVDYDDEDAICQDNLGQVYYRCLNDKVKAKEAFDRAHSLKPGQIDTLWFLSRYDLEAGDKAAAAEKLKTALEGRFSPLNYASKAMVEAELKQINA